MVGTTPEFCRSESAAKVRDGTDLRTRRIDLRDRLGLAERPGSGHERSLNIRSVCVLE
jgi:hypothetical protein